MLVGNIYVPPNNEKQLHTLDKVLESLKNETVILLGDFNARNIVWDKHTKQNTKLGAILEDIIQWHSLYIATDVNHTYHHSTNFEQSGKITIDIAHARGVQNISIKAFDLKTIKTRHTAIEIQVEDTNNSCCFTIPHFKTKNSEWSRWKSYWDNELSTYITSFPETISEELIDMEVIKLSKRCCKLCDRSLGWQYYQKRKAKVGGVKTNKAWKAAKNAQFTKKGKLQQTCNTLISKKYFSKI